MQIDHIFIFSREGGKEAHELVKFGLTEGSSRIHKGQGTTNRKFYFENFFLEILWVHDEAELRSEKTKLTKLWERSCFKNNSYSPFGLCLVNENDSDKIFMNSSTYQPDYFPEGMSIEFITEPALPWLFRLPFKNQKKDSNEPKEHRKSLHKLTKTVFETPYKTELTTLINKLSQDTIQFNISNRKRLTLEFDYLVSKEEHHFEKLPLTIKY